MSYSLGLHVSNYQYEASTNTPTLEKNCFRFGYLTRCDNLKLSIQLSFFNVEDRSTNNHIDTQAFKREYSLCLYTLYIILYACNRNCKAYALLIS